MASPYSQGQVQRSEHIQAKDTDDSKILRMLILQSPLNADGVS